MRLLGYQEPGSEQEPGTEHIGELITWLRPVRKLGKTRKLLTKSTKTILMKLMRMAIMQGQLVCKTIKMRHYKHIMRREKMKFTASGKICRYYKQNGTQR